MSKKSRRKSKTSRDVRRAAIQEKQKAVSDPATERWIGYLGEKQNAEYRYEQQMTEERERFLASDRSDAASRAYSVAKARAGTRLLEEKAKALRAYRVWQEQHPDLAADRERSERDEAQAAHTAEPAPPLPDSR